MGLLWRPVNIVLGIVSGFAGRSLFNWVWGRFDDEEPPRPNTRDTTWGRVLASAGLQGAIFALTKAVTLRYGARFFYYFFGSWPGEKKPDPE